MLSFTFASFLSNIVVRSANILKRRPNQSAETVSSALNVHRN